MAKPYETYLAPISPTMRSQEQIKESLNIGVAMNSKNLTAAKLAQIEVLITEGDNLFREQKYLEAGKRYKEARAEIFALMYPTFSISKYLLAKDTVLPLNRLIEANLQDISARMIDTCRPKIVEREPVFWPTDVNPLPRNLAPMTKIGFHEQAMLKEDLEAAVLDAAFLLEDGKPQSAAYMLLAAKARVRPNLRVDSRIIAAIDMNLAVAYIQMGQATNAAKSAKEALSWFSKAKDVVGQSQATHLAGIAALERGQKAEAARKFKQAAKLFADYESGGLTLDTPVRLGYEAPQAELTLPDRISVLRNKRRNLPLSRDLASLKEVIGKNPRQAVYRVPGREDGWRVLPLPDAPQRAARAKTWKLGVPLAGKVVTFELGETKLIKVADLVKRIYQPRVNAAKLGELAIEFVQVWSPALYLLHLYGFVLPMKIGDSFHWLGLYAKAEKNYLAVTKYSYLNKTIEATQAWVKLARNSYKWGVSLYKREKFAQARKQFEKVVMGDGSVPNSFLYTETAFAYPANQARQAIAALGNIGTYGLDTSIAIYVAMNWAQLANLIAGFDYYGLMISPIHTFEYLEKTARGFCLEAIQAEREFINFKSREEMEAATRRDLEAAVAMAEAELKVQDEQHKAAEEDVDAAEQAVNIATERRDNAVQERNEYASTSWDDIWARASSMALSGGEDAYWSEINGLADQLARGETISGPGPKLAAAQTLLAGRRSREYELNRMQNRIDELTEAITLAQEQLAAATHRERAAKAALEAAQKKLELVNGSLEAFDDEFFTPDAWNAMADIVRDISESYLERAIRIAKLMERSFNFENDMNVHIIKMEYGYSVANEAPGADTKLLGGNVLQNDIDSFRYRAITQTTRKSSRIKDVISMSTNYPAEFENFKQSGLLEIETDLYEFDRMHPGFYEQRIEGVELEVIGLLAGTPLQGTLRTGGVTRFRRKNFSVGSRTHVVDTLALSDYKLRDDILLFTADTGIRGIFQGIGLGATWRLHLPRRSNDFDLRRIFDIRLILYYKAKFDENLRQQVLTAPPLGGEYVWQRTYSLRHDFPAAWYAFYKSGETQYHLAPTHLPFNQTNFDTSSVLFRVVTKEGVSPDGIEVQITGPNGSVATSTTNAHGVVSTSGGMLAGLVSINPIGDWIFRVTGGPSLMVDSEIDFELVRNVQMGLEYNFEYLPEEI
jgi:tetratricopeptide (TPR) repeat protein